jgi:hypothetical protein
MKRERVGERMGEGMGGGWGFDSKGKWGILGFDIALQGKLY